MSHIEQLEKELKIAQLKVNEEKYRRNARKQEQAADDSKKQWLELENAPLVEAVNASSKPKGRKTKADPKKFNPASTD